MWLVIGCVALMALVPALAVGCAVHLMREVLRLRRELRELGEVNLDLSEKLEVASANLQFLLLDKRRSDVPSDSPPPEGVTRLHLVR